MRQTIASALAQATAQLEAAGSSESCRLDAEVLLEFVLQKSRAALLANSDEALSEFSSKHFFDLVQHRARQYPTAYLIGEKEFWSMTLTINESVLVPRPETELLVEQALYRCQSNPQTVLDLGTGCGAIALAIARERPDCVVVASDFSSAAVNIAERNRERHELRNVTVVKADWFEGIDNAMFDLIVSNPPYIDPDDPHLDRELRYEPQSALIAMDRGLADIAHIAANAREHLSIDGWLLLEHGYDQAEAVSAILAKCGYRDMQTLQDISGKDRVTEGRRPAG